MSVRVIGIDPGLRHTGWGVIEVNGSHLRYVASGRISPDPSADLSARLCTLASDLGDMITQHGPTEAAVEETFVNANPQTTLRLGQARGICLFAPAQAGLAVAEYAANRIKKAVVGVGHADKTQVSDMVKRLLSLRCDLAADEADALAMLF